MKWLGERIRILPRKDRIHRVESQASGLGDKVAVHLSVIGIRALILQNE